VTPCSLVGGCRRFRGTSSLRLEFGFKARDRSNYMGWLRPTGERGRKGVVDKKGPFVGPQQPFCVSEEIHQPKHFSPEDGMTLFFRKVGFRLQDYAVSQSKRPTMWAISAVKTSKSIFYECFYSVLFRSYFLWGIRSLVHPAVSRPSHSNASTRYNIKLSYVSLNEA
jgi:hypothetical protein